MSGDKRCLDSSQWQGIDESGDPGAFVSYLEESAALLREPHRELLRRLDLMIGCSVLDVGCGAGDMLLDFVASAGVVTGVGIDASEAMIDAARSRAEAGTLPVTFEVGDAQNIDFADESFDRVVCSRVLIHLERPAAAVAEMVRVLRPGGRLAILEPDFDAFLIDSEDLSTARAVRAALAGGIRNPDMGRRLRRLLLDLGVEAIEVSPRVGMLPSLELANRQFGLLQQLEAAVASGTVSRPAADSWRAWLEAADASGRFGFWGVAFIATARKPAH